MTSLILNIIVCIIFGILVFQDFKYRAIHAIWVLAIFGVGCFILWEDQKSMVELGRNNLFTISLVSLLWLYLSAKERKIINPFSHNIGLGDVLFFFAITPLFSLHNFMLFFISGMFVSILFAVIFRKYVSSKLIPLAGILSGYLLILKVTSFCVPLDIFYSS